MSLSAHTPGPWKVGPHGDTVEAHGDDLLCMYETNGADDPVNLPFKANAHLIAAAPELLAALKLFMTCYPAAICALSDEMQQSIRAAIAKAEGRS